MSEDSVKRGDTADIFSPVRPWSPLELSRINLMLDTIYDDFVNKAARDRNRSVEEFEKFCRGRVWTGLQCVENGLVDQLGGLMEAIDEAKTLAGYALDDKRVRVAPYEELSNSLFMGFFFFVLSHTILNTVHASLRPFAAAMRKLAGKDEGLMFEWLFCCFFVFLLQSYSCCCITRPPDEDEEDSKKKPADKAQLITHTLSVLGGPRVPASFVPMMVSGEMQGPLMLDLAVLDLVQ